jgi:hypothetical protein
MRMARLIAVAAGAVLIGVSGAIAGDGYGDKLIFGSVSSLSLGNRDVSSSDEGSGQTLELNSTSAYNIPIWKSFSMQIDSFSEYYYSANDHTDPLRTNALGLHLSYRNPNKGLIGVFGGYAWTKVRDAHGASEFQTSIFGAEAQLYHGNWTFYVQGGVADVKEDDPETEGFNKGWFVRGVTRYFFTPDSKLEAEVSFAQADPYLDGGGPGANSGEFLSWGVSLDHKLFNVFSVPVYGTVAYRGGYYDAVGEDHATEHVVKAGIKVLFGARDLKHNDRYGATLDLPTLPIRANHLTENLD